MATDGGVSISSLLSMLRDYQGTSLTLWNLCIVVVFALLGFVIGTAKPAGHSVRALMTVGFLAFVGGNVTFLERCQRIIYALSAELQSTQRTSSFVPMPSGRCCASCRVTNQNQSSHFTSSSTC
jgi:hypothetical protein